MVATVLTMIVLMVVTWGLVGRNDMHTWQYVQQLDGDTFVINQFGWYWKGLAQVTTYPEVLEIYGTKGPTPGSPGDDSANVKFNDGGSADIDWYGRIRLPKPQGGESAEELEKIIGQQREFHRMFRNKENAISAVRSHVRDCVSKTGNIMSASENQAARKAEFYAVAYGQFKEGYFEMRKVVIRRKGLTDLMQAAEAASIANLASVAPVGSTGAKTPSIPKSAEGMKSSYGQSLAQQDVQVIGEESIEASDTVRAAEIVYGKDGKPAIATPSPLKAYGMEVLQFSIIETEYDKGTLEKFKEKRALLLATETARAEAVRSAQERLKNIAEGNKAIAEQEALANQEMARKVIAAQILQEVEGIKTKQREVEGATKVLTAEVMGKQLDAEREKAVLDAQTAENARKAAEITAQVQEQMIALGGAVSDAEKTLQEVYTKQTEAVAKSLAGLQVPDTVIIAMDSIPEGQSPLAMALPSLQFLKAAGLIEPLKDTVDSKWLTQQVGEMPKIVLPPVGTADPLKAKVLKP